MCVCLCVCVHFMIPVKPGTASLFKKNILVK